MYEDENVNVNMLWKDEWIMIWISTYYLWNIPTSYEGPMNDISE